MENNNGKNKDPEFIKEVVKEKKKSKKSLVFKVIFILAVAAAAAAIAAVVFALTYSGFRSVFGENGGDSSKVSISDAQSSVSSSESVSSDPVDSSSASSVSESAPETEEEQENVTEIIYDTDITLQDYRRLYNEMRDTANKAQDSLVSVTGITSRLDYFNESYENEQMSIGLIVAENNAEYYILTYSNILENVENIRVTFKDMYSVSGALQRSDPNTGLAVVRVDKSSLSQEACEGVAPLSFGTSATIRAGDLIMAIGNPNGYDDYIAYGAVTSASNEISFFDTEYDLLTTDISDSSDGIGIVINLDGNAVGITSPSTDQIGGSTMTALAISDIRELVENLSNDEARTYAGIKGSDVTANISAETGIPTGVIVISIAENSPAMLSGLMEYDIITSIDGNLITSMEQYTQMLKNYEPGTSVTVSVMRQVADGYTPIELTLQLGEI